MYHFVRRAFEVAHVLRCTVCLSNIHRSMDDLLEEFVQAPASYRHPSTRARSFIMRQFIYDGWMDLDSNVPLLHLGWQ